MRRLIIIMIIVSFLEAWSNKSIELRSSLEWHEIPEGLLINQNTYGILRNLGAG